MATYYWVGGSGTWDNSNKTNWSNVSGGAGGFGPPTSADNVNFDSGSGTSAVVSVATTAVCNICTINKSDINVSLSGSPTFSSAFALTAGLLTLNTYTLTCASFSSNNSNTRTIDFGTGNLVLTGNGLTIWGTSPNTGFSVIGTPTVELSYTGSTGTRTINVGTGLTEANTCDFYITGGSDTISFSNRFVRALSFNGFSGTATSTVTGSHYGDLTLSAGMTVNITGATTFAKTGGTQKITSNGKTLDCNVTFNGVNTTFQFEDDFVQGSTRSMTLTNGTLNGNDKNVTIGTFALGSGTKTLTLGNKTWTVVGATWNANTNVSGLTVSASTATISMTSGSAKTFSGGGKTFGTLNQGGSGNLTIAQSNTFANITNTVQPATVRLTAGTTQTVSALGLAGTSGNLITLDTTVAGTKATIYKATGSVSLSFVSIKDISATGGANFNAFTSNGCVDGGNNTGWDFNSALYPTIYTVRKTKRYFLN